MTTITIDRAVVEQALHVAEHAGYPLALIKALRTALAQEQAEPVQEPVRCPASHVCDCQEVGQPCARAASKPAQEPVAKVELMTTGGNAGLATRIVEIDDHLRERLRPGQLLYTSPPQRKPLTEGVLMGVYIDFDRAADPAWSKVEYLLQFARAVERALEEKNER